MVTEMLNNSLRPANLFPLQVPSFFCISVSLYAVHKYSLYHELEKCSHFISESDILEKGEYV